MEKYWYLFVFIAAISHAMWNFLLKQSKNKTIFLWFLRLWVVIIYFPIGLFFFDNPNTPLVYWLFFGMGSIILHGLYAIVLTKAYESEDFSIAYPVARGTGPLIVVVVGLFILHESVGMLNILGTVFILIGIYILYANENITAYKETLKAIFHHSYPLLVGILIASYTIFDKIAVGFIPPIMLGVIENFGQVLLLTNGVIKEGKEQVLTQFKSHWPKMLFAGFFSGLAYILVLFVLTKIPVSYVSPVRESSIVIGSLLGFFFLKESFSYKKGIGSIVIFTGVILIIMN